MASKKINESEHVFSNELEVVKLFSLFPSPEGVLTTFFELLII